MRGIPMPRECRPRPPLPIRGFVRLQRKLSDRRPIAHPFNDIQSVVDPRQDKSRGFVLAQERVAFGAFRGGCGDLW